MASNRRDPSRDFYPALIHELLPEARNTGVFGTITIQYDDGSDEQRLSRRWLDDRFHGPLVELWIVVDVRDVDAPAPGTVPLTARAIETVMVDIVEPFIDASVSYGDGALAVEHMHCTYHGDGPGIVVWWSTLLVVHDPARWGADPADATLERLALEARVAALAPRVQLLAVRALTT